MPGLLSVLAWTWGLFLLRLMKITNGFERLNLAFSKTPLAMTALPEAAAVPLEEERLYHYLLPTSSNMVSRKTGFIFYTGGFVEERAYAPLIQRIAETAGFSAFLLKAPLYTALGSPLSALQVMRDYRETIDGWVIAGHSLGGVVATNFVRRYLDRQRQRLGSIDGVVLLASYNSANLRQYEDLAVLTIWGSRDGLVTRGEWEGDASNLPANTTVFLEIDGGNHANMGYYGDQLRDNPAEITRDQQQLIVFQGIASLLKQIDDGR